MKNRAAARLSRTARFRRFTCGKAQDRTTFTKRSSATAAGPKIIVSMDSFDRIASAAQQDPQQTPRFNDRHEAGRILARQLAGYAGKHNTIVLGLPRGGVPVAYEIADALRLPLDIFVVKKISLPGYGEMALGAVASEGVYILDEELIEHLGLSQSEVEQIATTAYEEVERRESRYRDNRPPPRIEKQTVIVVDDGLATGSSMQVAVNALRRKHPARIVVAVPVASQEAAVEVKAVADELVCARIPDPFYAVGLWYDDFSQTSDEEVRELLNSAAARQRQAS